MMHSRKNAIVYMQVILPKVRYQGLLSRECKPCWMAVQCYILPVHCKLRPWIGRCGFWEGFVVIGRVGCASWISIVLGYLFILGGNILDY